MAIGLVTDEEYEREIGRKKVSVKTRGRSVGDNNIPESLRKIIGETAVIDGREAALELAEEFGVSSSSVSAYSKGATSTASYDTPAKSIIQHINKSRERAIKRASKTLNSALSAISQEKLDYADAKDLSGIAKDMAVIIKNLEPQQQSTSEASNGPSFVIFAPQFRKEESFDFIDVKE